ncbi:MAG: urease accessory protein UreD [Pseudomonadota bacterium]
MPRDDASLIAPPRAYGEAHVAAGLRGGHSHLAGLRQSGSAKVLLPRASDDDGLTAILLNTAGGITGGDAFAYRGEARAGTRLTLSTQAAERAYRAQPGETGSMNVALKADEGARIDWLPQETILFDGSSLARRLEVDLASDARFLAVEAVLLGRAAMGERLSDFAFTDNWRVRRGGALIYADAVRLSRDAMAGPATLSGAGAFASILLACPAAERHLAALRDGLGPAGGASVIRPGVLAARILCADGFALRQVLIPAIEALRGAPLPKAWRL